MELTTEHLQRFGSKFHLEVLEPSMHHPYILVFDQTAIRTFSKMIAASLSWLKSSLALDELLNNSPAHIQELIAWAGKEKKHPETQ